MKSEGEDLIVTEGGYKAIIRDGLVLRNSYVGRRLKEDGETFPEYKARRIITKWYLKKKARGTISWQSLIINPDTGEVTGNTFIKTKTEA